MLLLCALGLAGCASPQGAGSGTADPGSMAVANRLPERIGGWVRVRPPEPGAGGRVMMGYRLGEGLPIWATVAVIPDPTGAAVPDGPTAPIVLQLRPVMRARTAAIATDEVRVGANPGVPEQVCDVRVAESGVYLRRDYTCGTGAGGRAVMTLITFEQIPRTGRPIEMSLNLVAAILLSEVARKAAGIESAPWGQPGPAERAPSARPDA